MDVTTHIIQEVSKKEIENGLNIISIDKQIGDDLLLGVVRIMASVESDEIFGFDTIIDQWSTTNVLWIESELYWFNKDMEEFIPDYDEDKITESICS